MYLDVRKFGEIMKCILQFLFILYSTSLISQSLTQTYSLGDISTSYLEYSSTCTGPNSTISIDLPSEENVEVVGIDISYTMTADLLGYKSDQRSTVFCQNTGISEPTYSGIGDETGEYAYTRNGVNIANGIYAGNTTLTFEMRAWRTFNGVSGCNEVTNKVDNDSWQITIHYSIGDPVPKIGIGNSSPRATLDVSGKMKIGDDNTIPAEGMIRWNSNTHDFEGYTGIEWISLSKPRMDIWGGVPSSPENGVLIPDQTQSGDLLGYDIDIYEETAMIGAPGTLSNRGSVYFYKLESNEWVLDTIFSYTGTGVNARYGKSVAIHQNIALVGAPGANEVYFYRRINQEWTFINKIIPASGTINFGEKLDLFNSNAIIDSYDFPDLYTQIYIRNGVTNNWTLVHSKVTEVGEFFFMNNSISNDYAASYTTLTDPTDIQIYKRVGNDFIEDGVITTSGANTSGNLLALYNDKIAIRTSNGVEVYKVIDENWNLEQRIEPNGVEANSTKKTIALYDKTLVFCSLSDIEQCFVYEFEDDEWRQKAKLVASDNVLGDDFGWGVTVYNNNIFVGAPRKTIGLNNLQGKIYRYSKK